LSRHTTRTGPRVLGLITLAALLVATAWTATARADTVFPPGTGAFTVTLNVNGTNYSYPAGGPGPAIPNVTNGDNVTVTVADAAGGPDTNFARLRVRQCAGNREVSNNTEFNPQITNRCSSVTLGAGSTNAYVDSGPVAPGTTSLTTTFRIGAGTAPQIEDPVFGEIIPGFTCGVGNACKIVVNAEVATGTGSSTYLGFPINFLAPNGSPTVDAGPPVSGQVNTALALNGTVTDPDSPGVTSLWTITGSSCTIAAPASVDTNVTCTAAGTFTATLTANDGVNPAVSDTTTVTVTTAPPTENVLMDCNNVAALGSIKPTLNNTRQANVAISLKSTTDSLTQYPRTCTGSLASTAGPLTKLAGKFTGNLSCSAAATGPAAAVPPSGKLSLTWTNIDPVKNKPLTSSTFVRLDQTADFVDQVGVSNGIVTKGVGVGSDVTGSMLFQPTQKKDGPVGQSSLAANGTIVPGAGSLAIATECAAGINTIGAFVASTDGTTLGGAPYNGNLRFVLPA
jgi:hypothetical protein